MGQPCCHDRGSRTGLSPSPEYWLSHLSPYLGLIVLLHLHLIYNCTYKQHTYTHPLRSLDLPRLSPLSVFPFHSVFPGSYPCLVPRSSDTLLVTPTRTVSSRTLISAACPDHPACFSDHVSALPSLFLLLVIDPFLFDHSNKAANGSHSVWCVVTEDFTKQRSSSVEAVIDRTHRPSFATCGASTAAAASDSAHRAAVYRVTRSARNSTASRG